MIAVAYNRIRVVRDRRNFLMPELLFAYGTLTPDGPDEAERGGWEPDKVRGRLYDLGTFPALIDIDDPEAGWVAGYVSAIEPAKRFEQLDEYEGVAEGLYRRVRATTQGGREVWVYLYACPLPVHARGPIERWDGPRRRF